MMRSLFAAATLLVVAVATPLQSRPRWTAERANAWYAHQPFLVGANYVPANAINQLEMWQASTFDPATIDREFGWAAAAGLNTMRVYLHDLLWDSDRDGFTRRINTFLAIAARHRIKPILVLFDSCWDPFPKLGVQHPPIPGVHNSGWVQSPGAVALADTRQYPRLERYVKGVVGAFAKDDRILAWDVWNEPTSPSANYKGQPADKEALVAKLLPQVFAWAQSADPSQPITSGLANGPISGEEDWRPAGRHIPIEATQLAQSDILTFHDYSWPESFQRRIDQLKPYGRPIIATEFLARGAGSTFETVLPIARREHVGVVSWGLVDGKEQTRLPWDSWKRPYTQDQPVVWHHDLLHPDGTPYRQAEIDLIHAATATSR